jgi:hypothetical protein
MSNPDKWTHNKTVWECIVSDDARKQSFLKRTIPPKNSKYRIKNFKINKKAPYPLPKKGLRIFSNGIAITAQCHAVQP